MLVLSRKTDEDIVINHNIVVKVLAIRGDKVKLGFATNDSSIEINRGEIEIDKLANSHRPVLLEEVAELMRGDR